MRDRSAIRSGGISTTFQASPQRRNTRITQPIDDRDGVTETRLTGAIAWMVNGNIACAVVGDDLFVRVDGSDGDRILAGGARARRRWTHARCAAS